MAGGRPTALTPELGESICRLLKGGTPLEVAAETFGVSRHTVLEWVRRGEGSDDRPAEENYVEFANNVRQSIALFHQLCMQLVQEALQGSRPSKREKGKRIKSKLAPWRVDLALKLMARRYPQHWGAQRESPASVSIDVSTAIAQLQATPASARAAITKYFGNVTPEGTEPRTDDAADEGSPRPPDDGGGAPGQ